MTLVTQYPTTDTAVSGTWVDPTNVQADDGAVAAITRGTTKNSQDDREQAGYDFDSVIPAGATINSVAIEVEHRVQGTGNVCFLENLAYVGGVAGAVNSDNLEPTTLTARVYAAYARPGGGSWTRDDLLDANFKTRVRGRNGNNATSNTWEWDYIRVVVDYSASSIVEADGASSGAATVAAIAAAIWLGVGAVAAGASVNGIGAGTATADGAVSAVAVVTGSASVVALSEGAAVGTAVVTGEGEDAAGGTIIEADGASAGVASANGMAVAFWLSDGASEATASVSGVAAALSVAVGAAIGAAESSGVASACVLAEGAAVGQATVIGRAVGGVFIAPIGSLNLLGAGR